MRLQRTDDKYGWFLVRTAPLRDEHGNVVKWYGVSIYIEDRKRVERQSLALIDQEWPPDGTLGYCVERWRSYIGPRNELIAARILQWKSAAARSPCQCIEREKGTPVYNRCWHPQHAQSGEADRRPAGH